MLEYINYAGLGVILFIGVVIFIMDKLVDKKRSYWGFYIALSLLVGLLLLDADSIATATKESIYDFNNRNLTLKCTVGGGLYASANEYKVSKDDDWSLEKGHFIKDSLMVDASRCERW